MNEQTPNPLVPPAPDISLFFEKLKAGEFTTATLLENLQELSFLVNPQVTSRPRLDRILHLIYDLGLQINEALTTEIRRIKNENWFTCKWNKKNPAWSASKLLLALGDFSQAPELIGVPISMADNQPGPVLRKAHQIVINTISILKTAAEIEHELSSFPLFHHWVSMPFFPELLAWLGQEANKRAANPHERKAIAEWLKLLTAPITEKMEDWRDDWPGGPVENEKIWTDFANALVLYGETDRFLYHQLLQGKVYEALPLLATTFKKPERYWSSWETITVQRLSWATQNLEIDFSRALYLPYFLALYQLWCQKQKREI